MANKNPQAQESFGRFDFVGSIGIFGGISVLLVVLSLIYLAVRGINYGIDFKGGTEVEVKFSQPLHIDEVRKSLEGMKLGEVGVQSFGDGNAYIIRFQGEAGATDKETNENLNKAISDVKGKITSTFAAQNPDIQRVDTVGPQVS